MSNAVVIDGLSSPFLVTDGYGGQISQTTVGQGSQFYQSVMVAQENVAVMDIDEKTSVFKIQIP